MSDELRAKSRERRAEGGEMRAWNMGHGAWGMGLGQEAVWYKIKINDFKILLRYDMQNMAWIYNSR
jgi:hypothetical protein